MKSYTPINKLTHYLNADNNIIRKLEKQPKFVLPKLGSHGESLD